MLLYALLLLKSPRNRLQYNYAQFLHKCNNGFGFVSVYFYSYGVKLSENLFISYSKEIQFSSQKRIQIALSEGSNFLFKLQCGLFTHMYF